METTIKFLYNLLHLLVIFAILLFVAKMLTMKCRSSKKRRKSRNDRNKSVVYKLYILAITPILYKLDDKIDAQKQKRLEALAERQACKEDIDKSNVISFDSIKKSKNAK